MAERRKSGPIMHLVSIAAASVAVLALVGTLPPPQEREMIATVQSEPKVASVPLRPSYIVRDAPLAIPASAEPPPLRASLSVQPLTAAAEEQPEPSVDQWYVTAGALNVRTEPTSSSQQLAALPMGTPVEVLGTQGKWSEIATTDGLTGWAFSKYLSRTAPL
jgi:uncharacterized protein YgiM (DUF1202 family)